MSKLPGETPQGRSYEKALHWLLWLVPGGLAVALAFAASDESLWVDELHTSWTLSGTQAEIEGRARAGNQSPTFPWLLRGLCWTLSFLAPANVLDAPVMDGAVPQQEWWLRAPSILSFGLCVAIGCSLCASLLRQQTPSRRSAADGRSTNSRKLESRQMPGEETLSYTLPLNLHDGLLLVAAWIGWVVFDRIQLFYATEARVYGLLQLLTLVGWWAAYRISFGQTNPWPHKDNKKSLGNHRGHPVGSLAWGAVWLLCCIASVHLHLISGLVIAWQAIVVAFSLLLRRNWFVLAIWCMLLFVAMLLCLPAMSGIPPVWGRRQMWNSFAGDASPSVTVHLFPVLPILLPVAAGIMLQYGVRFFRGKQNAESGSVNRISGRLWTWSESWKGLLFWAIACMGPWLTAWALTAMDVLPVMHRRYVLGSALPMIVFSVLLLFRIQWRFLRWTILGLACVCLLVSQGTWAIWQQGWLIGPQRGEDWRAAAGWIQTRIDSGETPAGYGANGSESRIATKTLDSSVAAELWCASGLIEGRQVTPPMTAELREYLSFPLRGMYRVLDRQGEVCEPEPLLDDASLWLQQWGPIRERRSLFLVCRTSPNVIIDILENLGPFLASHGVAMRVREGPLAFGMITGVHLELAPQNAERL